MSASPERPVVAGLLLAAGSSTRMGAANKLLMPFEGEPLVRRAARATIDAGLAPVYVVVGHEAARVEGALEGLPVRLVHNPRHAEGQGSSLACGVAAVAASDARAVVVTLADMPWVTAAMIASLAARWRTSRPPLVLSDYGGVHAPPMLYDRALFDEIATLGGERAGKIIVARHRQRADVVAQPPDALRDVDTPDDARAMAASPAPRPDLESR